jgi:hypothetical protein
MHRLDSRYEFMRTTPVIVLRIGAPLGHHRQSAEGDGDYAEEEEAAATAEEAAVAAAAAAAAT